jgi:hypothetical protein
MMRLLGLVLGSLTLAGCLATHAAPPPPAGSYRAQPFQVRVAGASESLKGAAVTHAFFDAGRNYPVLGRTLLSHESESTPVAVVSYSLWERKLRKDPSAIGGTLEVNGRNVTIVGVMPRGFRVPDGAELWVPM